MHITAGTEHKEQLIRLWAEAFGDSEEYITRFLDNYFIPGCNTPAVVLAGGEIAAALYLIEFDLYYNGVPSGRSAYIFAAATKKSLRGRGYMSGLIEFTKDLCRNCGLNAIFLFPQESGLFDFYSKLGFFTYYRHKKLYSFGGLDCKTDSGSCITDTELCGEIYDYYTAAIPQEGFIPVKDREYFFDSARLYLEDGHLGRFIKDGQKLCYLFYRKYKNILLIDDIISCGWDLLAITDSLYNHLLNAGYCFEIILPHGRGDIPTAMFLPLDTKTEKSSGVTGGYINMFMNY